MNLIKELIFLKNYIDTNGNVNYEKMKNEKGLIELFDSVENIDISNFSRYELKAFWLNAYNISVIKKVLKKLEKNPNWKGNVGLVGKFFFFFIDKVKVANMYMTLNHMESKYIRKQFGDPRIHFAINCGSASCPILPSSLFKPDSVESILEILAKNFINDRSQVEFDQEMRILYLNPIFKWFANDFKEAGGILKFIEKYWDENKELLKGCKIKYVKYQWNLNSK